MVAGYSNNENNVFKDFPVIIFGDHTTILKYIDFEFIIGADGTKLLKGQKGNILKYLYYNLCLNNVKQDGYKRHFSIFSEIYLQLPSVNEQIIIASFLSAIDEKIKIQKEILRQYEKQKKYLLQQMFI